MQAPEFQDAR